MNYRKSFFANTGRKAATTFIFILTLLYMCNVSAASASANYLPVAAAVEQLRTAMIERKEAIDLYVQTEQDLSQKGAVSSLLTQPALEDVGDPRYSAGDYLRTSWRGCTTRTHNEGAGKWHIEFYDMEYRTCKSQEREFDAALRAIIEDLDIWTASDALKCKTIYSFITSHVAYDYDAYSEIFPSDSSRKQMSYTAYAAFFDRRAVCAGYAQLFYAMAHSVGITVRTVRGEACGKSGWDAHAWNAVQLGGEWYQLDCTWDAGDSIEDWEYFLKGASMPKHRITKEFAGMESLSTADYIFTIQDEIPVGRFHDISHADSYYEGAEFLGERGILTGTVNGYTFSPQESVSRGMCVEVLYRIAGRPKVKSSASFSDVLPDDYYWDAVQWATAEGIIAGYQDGKFHPSDTVSAEQMLTMLFRYAGRNEMSVMFLAPSFSIEEASPYAREAVLWAISTGIFPVGQLTASALNGPVNRGQLAEVLYPTVRWLDTHDELVQLLNLQYLQ